MVNRDGTARGEIETTLPLAHAYAALPIERQSGPTSRPGKLAASIRRSKLERSEKTLATSQGPRPPPGTGGCMYPQLLAHWVKSAQAAAVFAGFDWHG